MRFVIYAIGGGLFALFAAVVVTTRVRCVSSRLASAGELGVHSGPVRCEYSTLLGAVTSTYSGEMRRGGFTDPAANVTDDLVYVGGVRGGQRDGYGTAALDLPGSAFHSRHVHSVVRIVPVTRDERTAYAVELGPAPETPVFVSTLLSLVPGLDTEPSLPDVRRDVSQRALLVRGSWSQGLPHGRSTVSFPPVPGSWFSAMAGRQGIFGSAVEGEFEHGALEGTATLSLGPAAAVIHGSARRGWLDGMVTIDPFDKAMERLGGGSGSGSGSQAERPSPLSANVGLDEENSAFVMVVAGKVDIYSVNCSVSHVLGVGCETQLAKGQTCEDGTECAKVFQIVHDATQVLMALYLNIKMRLAAPPFPWSQHVNLIQPE